MATQVEHGRTEAVEGARPAGTRQLGLSTLDRSLLVVGLVLVLVGAALAATVRSAGGSVTVEETMFARSDGGMMSGHLYIPETATAETPAPGILAIHGYINSRETQQPFATELARRGYVVLALDQTGHGYSDAPAFGLGFGGPEG